MGLEVTGSGAVTGGRRWRVVVLAIAAVYFLLPLLAAAEFSLRAPGGGYGLANWLAIASDPVLLAALATSMQIAVVTAVAVLALVVPTAVWVRLQLPGLAGVLESATILPIVIPPVVMAAGIAFVQANLGGPAFRTLFASSTTALTPFYVILALPFAYRAVDNGLAAIPLRTLVEAARSRGVPHAGARARRDRHRPDPAVHRHVPGRDRRGRAEPGGRGGGAVPGEPAGHLGVAARRVAGRVASDEAGVVMSTDEARRAGGTSGAPGNAVAVEFRGIRRSYGDTHALAGLDLALRPGGLLALLGPSGCGKTTALRLLAGFDRPTAGQVLIDGRDVTDVSASRRDTGMVFQAYSLFPTMTAAENVAFGLRLRKVGAAERRRRAADLLELVGLGDRGGSYPHQLSGGQ
jgi:ABC-type multidrug transport system fused ATPase/permease subunit